MDLDPEFHLNEDSPTTALINKDSYDIEVAVDDSLNESEFQRKHVSHGRENPLGYFSKQNLASRVVNATGMCCIKPVTQCKHMFCPQAYESNGYFNETAPCYIGCCIRYKETLSSASFNSKKCIWSIFVVSLVLLCIAVFVYSKETILAVLIYVEAMDTSVSFFLFVILFTIFSFPMTWGYFPLNLAAGYLYGCVAGIFVVSVSVTFGIVIAHFFCQLFFTSCILKILQRQSNYEQMEAILNIIDGPNGVKIIILARMTPIPFGFQNGLFAVSARLIRFYFKSSLFNS